MDDASGWLTPNGYCGACRKVFWYTHDDAQHAVRAMNHRNEHDAASTYGRSRAYHCTHCDGWHLTSRPPVRSQTMGINKVIIVGNLGRDPEVRYAQSGMAICKLSVAVTERVKDGSDGWKDATEWFRVTLFGKTAENAGQYLQKGRQVYVEGRLKTDKYKDKEGVERTSVEVIGSTVQFLGGNSGGGGGGRRRQDDSPPDDAPDDAPPASDGFIDDDLPF